MMIRKNTVTLDLVEGGQKERNLESSAHQPSSKGAANFYIISHRIMRTIVPTMSTSARLFQRHVSIDEH